MGEESSMRRPTLDTMRSMIMRRCATIAKADIGLDQLAGALDVDVVETVDHDVADGGVFKSGSSGPRPKTSSSTSSMSRSRSAMVMGMRSSLMSRSTTWPIWSRTPSLLSDFSCSGVSEFTSLRVNPRLDFEPAGRRRWSFREEGGWPWFTPLPRASGPPLAFAACRLIDEGTEGRSRSPAACRSPRRGVLCSPPPAPPGTRERRRKPAAPASA